MSDSSEGVISFSVPSPPDAGGGCPLLFEDGPGRRAAAAAGEGMARGFVGGPGAPPPGTFWNEESGASCPATDSAARARGGGSGRRTTVSYVINEASPGLLQAAESGALQSLREACEAVGADLQTLHFGKLDFGETAVLDRFYNAGEAPARPAKAGKARRAGLSLGWEPGSPRLWSGCVFRRSHPRLDALQSAWLSL